MTRWQKGYEVEPRHYRIHMRERTELVKRDFETLDEQIEENEDEAVQKNLKRRRSQRYGMFMFELFQIVEQGWKLAHEFYYDEPFVHREALNAYYAKHGHYTSTIALLEEALAPKIGRPLHLSYYVDVRNYLVHEELNLVLALKESYFELMEKEERTEEEEQKFRLLHKEDDAFIRYFMERILHFANEEETTPSH